MQSAVDHIINALTALPTWLRSRAACRNSETVAVKLSVTMHYSFSSSPWFSLPYSVRSGSGTPTTPWQWTPPAWTSMCPRRWPTRRSLSPLFWWVSRPGVSERLWCDWACCAAAQAVLWWVPASCPVTVAVIATDGTRGEMLVNSNGQSPGQSTRSCLLLVSIWVMESFRWYCSVIVLLVWMSNLWSLNLSIWIFSPDSEAVCTNCFMYVEMGIPGVLNRTFDSDCC